MAKIFMLIPATENTGLTNVSLALTKAFNANGIKAAWFQPVDQKAITTETTDPRSISLRHVRYLTSRGYTHELLENIVALYKEKVVADNDVVVVRPLSYLASQPFVFQRNMEIANALSANIIILASAASAENKEDLETRINNCAAHLGGRDNPRILGYIINNTEIKDNHLDSYLNLIISIPAPDSQIDSITKQFDRKLLFDLMNRSFEPKITPPYFMYNLVKMAQAANKTIVLPESADIRVLNAASICARKNIARIILFGDSETVINLAKQNDIDLPAEISILNPQELAEKYVDRLVEIRKNKGVTPELARELLKDWMTVATMMLEAGEVDGVVSGAIHTTANTIRPALQIIKTAPGMDIVSSVFFMFLPDQVLLYADCAVNPNPNAKELAQIAIQSADSAKLFNIEPRIAMISYSTGESGSGIDVEKVREATKLVKDLRPDLLIDGPLQYDAAIDESVAKLKLPNSPVAGKANLFIFPDLNTGNTVYKAVQRSAHILCIGPMLQGLNKPINDLSRGCLVEDIVFTIALTTAQASKVLK
jgi:phosphate acetyltransferase